MYCISECKNTVMARLFELSLVRTKNQFDCVARTHELLLIKVYMCTISEYAAMGCLYDHLANNKLNFEQILRWSTEIALGKQFFFRQIN